jgi:hypothetical protein
MVWNAEMVLEVRRMKKLTHTLFRQMYVEFTTPGNLQSSFVIAEKHGVDPEVFSRALKNQVACGHPGWLED